MPLALGAVGLTAALATAGCSGAPAAAPASPAVSPAPSPSETPQLRLETRISKVTGLATAGEARKRRLREPAQGVGRTVGEMYEAAYLDLEAWSDGRSTDHLASFTRDAAAQGRRDVRNLALGPVGSRLTSVEARPLRLNVRFLLARNRRPAAALVSARFDATGESADGAVRIRQRAEYTLRRVGGGWRVAAYDAAARVGPRRPASSAYSPGLLTRDPLIVLVIGSDARPGQSVTRSRADSLHLVGVNPARGSASVLGIPRDSYVPIPGAGSEKINASLFFGGPQRTVETVERLTGARIDAYLLTGFDSFRRLIRLVGGVEVRIPYPINDHYSGAHFRQGRTRLTGRGALAFSRNRHDAPGGDFGRSLNQGRLLIAALAEFREDVRRDPVQLFRWLWAGARSIQTDLSLDEMLQLSLAAMTIEPGRVDNRVVSGSGGTVGGASVIRLGSSAHAMFRDMARDGVLGR
jgi:polyisoprenyl-teichoic acid--peptidoglycan teichoic acid transferase